MGFIKRLICTRSVERNYVKAGVRYALAIASGLRSPHIDKERDAFACYEKSYAELGYRTLNVKEFARLGPHGSQMAIEPKLRQLRAEGEAPIFYAGMTHSFTLGTLLDEEAQNLRRLGKDLDEMLKG